MSDAGEDPPSDEKAAIPQLTDEEAATFRSLLKEGMIIEEERARVYGMFEEGFNIFAKTHDGAAYQRLCAEVAQQFQALSQRMLALEPQFRACNAPVWADRIHELQQFERERLTVKITMYRLQAKYTVLADLGDDEDYTKAARSLRTRLHGVSAALTEALEEFRYAGLAEDGGDDERDPRLF